MKMHETEYDRQKLDLVMELSTAASQQTIRDELALRAVQTRLKWLES